MFNSCGKWNFPFECYSRSCNSDLVFPTGTLSNLVPAQHNEMLWV